MDYIKQWTFCVCVTVIISVIFSFLKPNGNMGKFFKIILSVFIFISLINPIMNYDFNNLKIDDVNSKNYTNSSIRIETMLENKIKNTLKDKKIIGANVDTKIKMEDNIATVENIQVAVGDEYDLKKVKKIIYDELGLNVSVIHIGEW